jgi:heme exporter protein C
MPLPVWFHKLGSPPHVYRWLEALRPWLGWSALALIGAGLFGGLVLAPPDAEMGDGFRIIYIHVPSAYLGTRAYVVLAVAAAVGFIWRIKLAHAVAVSVAPLGAACVVMAAATGALWGKPMWNTYWQWSDARLMTWVVQFFLYVGYMVLHASFDDRDKADRISAILAVVGIVNVPLIYYSVEWWQGSLHQPATIMQLDRPAIEASMAVPLVVSIFGFFLWFGWVLVNRLQAEIVERERDSRWLADFLPPVNSPTEAAK